MNLPSFRSPVSDQTASREFMQWITERFDRILGHVIVTATGISPSMKKDQTLVWQDTSISKTYIVHYDGTHKYFWEVTGTDLY